VAGLPTNLGFLQDLSAHPAFAVDLDLDTGFIERHRASLLPLDESVAPEVAALAGALWGKLAVGVLWLLATALFGACNAEDAETGMS
jgi:acetyl/propionyl-CoA carboxylase alpha subunit